MFTFRSVPGRSGRSCVEHIIECANYFALPSSDADSDVWISKLGIWECSSDNRLQVLADYVLALIRAELSETDLRTSAIESLEDFLKDSK